MSEYLSYNDSNREGEGFGTRGGSARDLLVSYHMAFLGLGRFERAFES